MTMACVGVLRPTLGLFAAISTPLLGGLAASQTHAAHATIRRLAQHEGATVRWLRNRVLGL